MPPVLTLLSRAPIILDPRGTKGDLLDLRPQFWQWYLAAFTYSIFSFVSTRHCCLLAMRGSEAGWSYPYRSSKLSIRPLCRAITSTSNEALLMVRVSKLQCSITAENTTSIDSVPHASGHEERPSSPSTYYARNSQCRDHTAKASCIQVVLLLLRIVHE